MSIDNGEKELSDLERFEEMFGSDPEKEADGEWMPVPGNSGWRVLMRSQHSPKWLNFAAKIQRKYAPLYQSGSAPDARDLNDDKVEALAKVGVITWEGFPVPYSQNAVRAWMAKYPAFRDACMTWAGDRANFRRAQIAAIEKNSEPQLVPRSA